MSTPNELDRTLVSENTSISKGEVRTGCLVGVAMKWDQNFYRVRTDRIGGVE